MVALLNLLIRVAPALNAATGLSIPVVPQSKRASDKTQPEILVGDTNRDASYDGRDQVQGSGFVIKKEGNKLVARYL